MSRIGKKPIDIPDGVNVKIERQKVTISGPKGQLSREIRPEIKVEIRKGKIYLTPKKSGKNVKAFWGLSRAILFNMVEGVTKGFEKKLEIQGTGYKGRIDGENLILNVGFSHEVKISPPEGIKFSVEKNIITVFGIDKEKVGQVAAKIRKIRPPNPYTGKGIKYLGEQVRKKEGKKAITSA